MIRLTETQPPPASPSLFQGLLGGRLEVLTEDAARNPERYDARMQAFLEELGAGTRTLEGLSPGDKAMLDRAVLDFAAFRPPRPPPTAPKRMKPAKPALLREEGELPDGREPQVEMPGGVMTAYWWT